MFPRVHWNPLKTKTVNSAVQIRWASVHLERCGRKCILSCQTLNYPGKIHANRRQGGRVCVFGVTFRAFISASKSKRNLIFFRTSTKQAHRRWCLLSKPFSASFPLPPPFPVNLFAYSRTFKRKRANFSRCRPGVESHRGGGKQRVRSSEKERKKERKASVCDVWGRGEWTFWSGTDPWTCHLNSVPFRWFHSGFLASQSEGFHPPGTGRATRRLGGGADSKSARVQASERSNPSHPFSWSRRWSITLWSTAAASCWRCTPPLPTSNYVSSVCFYYEVDGYW